MQCAWHCRPERQAAPLSRSTGDNPSQSECLVWNGLCCMCIFYEVCLTQESKRHCELIHTLPYLVHDQAKIAQLVGAHYSEDCVSAEQRLLVGCWCECHRRDVEKSGPGITSMQCNADMMLRSQDLV